MNYTTKPLKITLMLITSIIKDQKIILSLIFTYLGLITSYLITRSYFSPENFTIKLTNIGVMEIIFAYDQNFLFLSSSLLSLVPLVFLYISEYHNKQNFSKSLAQLYFFIFLCSLCLLAIALSANLFTMFISYELLTLCTIPLIICGTGDKAKSSLKYYLTLLISSSLFLVLPIIIIIGSQNFSNQGIIENNFSTISGLLILCSLMFGFSKAAIFPLHSWIIKAMIAPYPISGIIHGVIVVKAGIICLLKIFYLVFGINYFKTLIDQNIWLMAIPIISMLYASIKANIETKIKKILAFSTISQLSFIILIAMNNNFAMVQIAVLNHAINKLMLFLTFGVLFYSYDVNRLEDLKSLYKTNKTVLIYIILSTLCIAGIPLSAGGIIKSNIVTTLSVELNILFSICTILTISYLYRLVRHFFINAPVSNKIAKKNISLNIFAHLFIIANLYLSMKQYYDTNLLTHDLIKFFILCISGIISSHLIEYIHKTISKFSIAENIFKINTPTHMLELSKVNIDYQLLLIIAGLIMFLSI